MTFKTTTLLAFAALFLALPSMASGQEAAPSNTQNQQAITPLNVWGVWFNPDQTAKIDITDCGDATPCGHIIWVTYVGDENPLDGNNPDPALAARPLTGVKMLHSFSRKNAKWASGKIYNPEDGKSYKSSIKTLEDSTLEVKGCLGPFCKTQIWTRPAQ